MNYSKFKCLCIAPLQHNVNDVTTYIKGLWDEKHTHKQIQLTSSDQWKPNHQPSFLQTVLLAAVSQTVLIATCFPYTFVELSFSPLCSMMILKEWKKLAIYKYEELEMCICIMNTNLYTEKLRLACKILSARLPAIRYTIWRQTLQSIISDQDSNQSNIILKNSKL